jgi:predicted DCC family thiol-disulfide oxidoreductase YuxK
MHDADAVALLEAIAEEERYASWHLFHADGSTTGRGAGGVELLRGMRLTRKAAPLAARVPTPALDALYSAVARRRSFIGRLVPNRSALRRYP